MKQIEEIHSEDNIIENLDAVEDLKVQNINNFAPFQISRLKKAFTLNGIGIHSGKKSKLKIQPAKQGSGYRLIQINPETNTKSNSFSFSPDSVVNTNFCTTIASKDSKTVISTVEHVLAALAAFGIYDILFELTGSEFPILDGSSKIIVDEIINSGFELATGKKSYIKLIKDFYYKDELTSAEYSLTPKEYSSYNISISPFKVIKKPQNFVLEHLNYESFDNAISKARSFVFFDDIKGFHQRGLGLGGSIQNLLIIGNEGAINPEGYRYKNECARHKILDLIGDFALIGKPICAGFKVLNPGHGQNNRALKALIADSSVYKIETYS